MVVDTDVSLKAFHLFFVAVCVLLAAFVAVGDRTALQTLGETATSSRRLVQRLTGAGLAVYGAAFQRKMRRASDGLPGLLWRLERTDGDRDQLRHLVHARRGRNDAVGVCHLFHLSDTSRQVAARPKRVRTGDRLMLNYLGMPPQAATHAGEGSIK